jgi:alanine racemase
LWHVVHNEAQIDMLAVHKTHQPHRVFLKMNSGMNRLGFAPTGIQSGMDPPDALPQVDEISLMTHFSDADGDKGIEAAVNTSVKYTHDLSGERSLCNSAAALRHAKAQMFVPIGCVRHRFVWQLARLSLQHGQ